METSETKVYLVDPDGNRLAELPEFDAVYADDPLGLVRITPHCEFSATINLSPERAARTYALLNPTVLMFCEAYRETVLADRKRFHILCHTKRARIRKKKHKAFVEELTARMDAKLKAREDHATV